MNTSIELIAEFISPYEDNLTFAFISDNLDLDTKLLFTKTFNKTRKSLPEKLNKINYITLNSSDLFHNKFTKLFNSNICIQFFDEKLSNNILAYLTDNLDDELEGMLIDKHIIQLPQEKYIFDITSTPDIILKQLCQKMDDNYNCYNYLISENYLAIWMLINDEFIQTL